MGLLSTGILSRGVVKLTAKARPRSSLWIMSQQRIWDMNINTMEESWIRRGRPGLEGVTHMKGVCQGSSITLIPTFHDGYNIFIYALIYTCIHLVHRCSYICICIYNTHRCCSVLCATLEPLSSLLP